MIDKADTLAMFVEKLLDANAIEGAAWTEVLLRFIDRDSAAAVAIHKHVDATLDNEARIAELPEDEIVRIMRDEDADAAVARELEQSAAATWRAIVADLGDEKDAEIKRFIDDLRQR